MTVQHIKPETKRLLRKLAERYEVCTFSENDPSCVLCRFTTAADMEVGAFIMSVLSFGRRDLFMKKADGIFSIAGNHPARWIKSGSWEEQFPEGKEKFYRFYSFDDMRDVFRVLQKILTEERTVGSYMKRRYERACKDSCETRVELADIVSAAFTGCRAVPHTVQSANKRVNMFLRWMVRTDSPVDCGLWTWYSPSELLIPLDTHVLQEAVRLGLIPEKSPGTAKTARALTEVLRLVWPDDPCRGDFALFGLGIDGSIL
jgi:conserved hypothetical protein TIGR02757